jgi:hypothetical protein
MKLDSNQRWYLQLCLERKEIVYIVKNDGYDKMYVTTYPNSYKHLGWTTAFIIKPKKTMNSETKFIYFLIILGAISDISGSIADIQRSKTIKKQQQQIDQLNKRIDSLTIITKK